MAKVKYAIEIEVNEDMNIGEMNAVIVSGFEEECEGVKYDINKIEILKRDLENKIEEE
jgi:hypothetical protein